MTDGRKYQVMPPLSVDEYESLKADIAARGVLVPVEYDETGAILDGHHRVQICGELGVGQWPRLIRSGLTEVEKRQHARRLNLDRRHLDREQRRRLIAESLRELPEASDRAVGVALGVDHKTVGSVRERLESTGEIPQMSERKGRDGRTRKLVQFIPATDEEKRGLLLSAKSVRSAAEEHGRQARKDLAQVLSDASAELPSGRRFPAAYIDCPWQRKAGIGNRAYENHYPTMRWPKILALLRKARDVLQPNSWVFFWIPRAHLLAPVKTEIEVKVAGEVVTANVKVPLAWACQLALGMDSYSTCFVWTKTNEETPDDHGLGMIAWDQDELLLLFKRGQGLPKPRASEKFGSNHRERAREHSRKPDFYRHMIATMVGCDRYGKPLPVLEMFARVDAEHPLPPRWVPYGNQANVAEETSAESEWDGELDDDIVIAWPKVLAAVSAGQVVSREVSPGSGRRAAHEGAAL